MGQMRQLTVMRGLMSDVDGGLVEVPILSNFKVSYLDRRACY